MCNHWKESVTVAAAPVAYYDSPYSHIYWRKNEIIWKVSEQNTLSGKDTIR